MKALQLLLGLAIMAVSFLSGVGADQCAKGATEVSGNWFCQEVNAIKYHNVGLTGTYNEVVHMGSDGTCQTKVTHFRGPLAPFNEELSLHVRGPVALKQFAAYNIQGPSRVAKRSLHFGHAQLHRRHDPEKRDKILATIDGEIVSWTADTAGYYTPNPVGGRTSLVTVTTTICPVSSATPTGKADGFSPDNVAEPKPTYSDTAGSLAENKEIAKSKHSFKRVSYYNAASQVVDNVVFLGNHGGVHSGVFDYHFGASQSYVNSKGTGGSASPEVLEDTIIPSSHEISIFTAEKCDKNCGYVRPGAVAYRGFVGEARAFLIEFQMPLDGNRGFQGDTPAIWLLNAKIPRTAMYMNCSCWSNCGEIDIAEALDKGSLKLKSTIHDHNPGGDSDYFARPTETTVTYLVTLRDDTVFIARVDNLAFPNELTSDYLDVVTASVELSKSDFVIAHFA
ncbi:hypothetical protein LZ554_008419 [Drepanopeziza brunnea f. sp. 'monogermtubi']|nr:hypothetical protein LZ554_008419 [Drepanopeziza brunnea f. sp. 'monogermtubi']